MGLRPRNLAILHIRMPRHEPRVSSAWGSRAACGPASRACSTRAPARLLRRSTLSRLTLSLASEPLGGVAPHVDWASSNAQRCAAGPRLRQTKAIKTSGEGKVESSLPEGLRSAVMSAASGLASFVESYSMRASLSIPTFSLCVLTQPNTNPRARGRREVLLGHLRWPAGAPGP